MRRSGKKERLLSLDALRGFTIIGMIIVNSPGSWSHVYPPLLHAPWHGMTLTDLVFPFFLFIMGISIALAYGRLDLSERQKAAAYRKIVIRGVKIFAVGLFLNLWPSFDLSEIRVAGVLQRIAIVFAVCAILFLLVSWKAQLSIGVGILLAYWGVMAWVPVPLDAVNELALESGYIERSYGQQVEVSVSARGEAYLRPNYEPGANVAAWVDRRLLPGRFWERTWDPEGLFTTLPAIGTGIFGLLVGALVLRIGDAYRRVSWLYLVGFAAVGLGTIWSWSFPLNKNLWSSSFVLVSGGWSAVCFASCVLLIDICGYKRWAKMGLVFGANPIVAYALSGMLLSVFYTGYGEFAGLNAWFMDAALELGLAGKLASLFYALFYVGIIYLPVRYLWGRGILIKL
ncbi:DUF5009 domain-containing protein [Pelagicoccus sp. SDUM812003]|uniref:acyltransferase family protein n=1 Tax=Pelagicoccus sp. SDUM812003 TaxID=3041267 RepID=UPI00280EBE41|nr:DUF5009 domain-containing protein [Pelagicoccus sp. SDUM812003]MDQ8205215.1 DUF5009 domain-containing protein [Pelagicoccus sp. SDUM812003]